MFNFFNTLKRDDLADIKETVKKINALEDEIALLSEREIKEYVTQLIHVIKLNKILIVFYVKVLRLLEKQVNEFLAYAILILN